MVETVCVCVSTHRLPCSYHLVEGRQEVKQHLPAVSKLLLRRFNNATFVCQLSRSLDSVKHPLL